MAICSLLVGRIGHSQTAAEFPPAAPGALRAWQESRFGMFIHWDPIAQMGKEISWSRGGERRDRSGSGEIAPEIYDNLYKTFNPVQFDAEKWVSIAKAAGMKYMVIVAKHHDGFCMFDSQLTDYKITNTPFKRDVCAELAAACRRQGMALGFYYSPPDWHDANFFTKDQDLYVKYMHGQVRELLTKYGTVSELWFDTDGGTNTPATWDNATLFPMIRHLQPQVLITKRCGGWGDFDTPEQRIGGFDALHPWEACMTISAHNAWAWGGANDGVKPMASVVRLLVGCAGGDGNMLLNVGPQPDGQINAEQAARLAEVGAWLQQFGESIYATRGGPFKPASWCASTCKDNIIYLHIFDWKGETVVLPPIGKDIVGSKLLAGGLVQVKQDKQGISISVPVADRQAIDTVVKLELNGPAHEIAPVDVAAN